MLGIRSQSKPHDIMHEVYRAMKTLGYVRPVDIFHMHCFQQKSSQFVFFLNYQSV